MERPQHGDEAELFANYNEQLLRKVRRAVHWTSLENVEDACNTAWMIFLRSQPDRLRSWRGWLFRVAVHEAMRLHKAEEGVKHLTFHHGEPDADLVWEPPDRRPSPQELRIELKEALAALSRVPERRREAAQLRAIGLKYREIAEILGLSYTRVDHLLAEANAYLAADAVRSELVDDRRPRVAQLQRLEQDPPGWLVRLIGRPPHGPRGQALLEWRRAALAVDDYRRASGTAELRDGLGERPTEPHAAVRWERARHAVARLEDVRNREFAWRHER